MLCSRISYLIADSRRRASANWYIKNGQGKEKKKETRDTMHAPSRIVVVVLCV
jgi:hypothetical protein